MIVDILGYRDWAEKVAKTVGSNNPGIEIHYHQELDSLCGARLVFAVGWSNFIPDDVLTTRVVLVVHPSPLPKYRGGSPIQHQMLAGEKVSAVTIFKLEPDREIDTGPIAWQAAFPMSQTLDEILKSITRLSIQGINTCIRSDMVDQLEFIEQDHSQATTFKRRQPWESEISREEITTWPAWKLVAKINGLADPYPNAFITCADGERMYITAAELE